MDISAYITLIESFITERILPVEFESKYLKLFKEEKLIPPAPIYVVLNSLFTDVDAFCSDPALRNQFSIDENELRERARQAYTELKRLEQVGR
jgi:Bacterial self-protective colicin-like immunity